MGLAYTLIRRPGEQVLARRAAATLARRLDSCPYPEGRAVGRALHRLYRGLRADEREWRRRIEAGRATLAARTDALVDGTLGDARLYDDGLTVAQVARVSKPPLPALWLLLLTRELAPATVLELGTNVGISSAFIGAGLALSSHGRLLTLDASQYRGRLARGLHRQVGLEAVEHVTGLFSDTLRPALESCGRVDLAFIDGDHQLAPTLEYLEAVLANAGPGAVLVFDDVRISPGMREAWARIAADPRLGLVVDLHSVGVAVVRRADIGGRAVAGPARCW